MASTMVSQTTDANIIGASKDLFSNDTIIVVEETESRDSQSEHITVENKTTEEVVREYFLDTPVMADIAFCESRFKHFDQYGNVLRGRVNSLDVGVMQINEKYHAGTASRLGINLYTLEGNLEYAKYLYETKGTSPWVHSSGCWNTVREVALK